MDSQLSSQSGPFIFILLLTFQFQTRSRQVHWPSFGFEEPEAVTEDPNPPNFRFVFGGHATMTQTKIDVGADVPLPIGYFSPKLGS